MRHTPWVCQSARGARARTPAKKKSPPQCRGDAVFESPQSNMGVASIPGCVIRALVPDFSSGRRLYTRPRSNELAPSGLSSRLPKIERLSTNMAEKHQELQNLAENRRNSAGHRLSESYSRVAPRCKIAFSQCPIESLAGVFRRRSVKSCRVAQARLRAAVECPARSLPHFAATGRGVRSAPRIKKSSVMPLDLVDTLSQLVAIPSVNPMGRAVSGPEYFEYRMTEWLQAFFERLSLPWMRQTVEPLRATTSCRKRFDGNPGPAEGGRVILFEAHQDTVPVDGMTIDPWRPTVRDGRLYGRGSCDIKGGMAAMLGALARLVEEKPRQRPTVIMACTVNEEHGYSGAQALTRLWTAAGNDSIVPRTPDMAVIAEPTNLDVVVAHKGAVPLGACHTHGRAAPQLAAAVGRQRHLQDGPSAVGVGKLRPRRARFALGAPVVWPTKPERGRDQWRSKRKHRAGPGDDRNRSPYHPGRGRRNGLSPGGRLRHASHRVRERRRARTSLS